MKTPSSFFGAWRRRSLRVDDGPPTEPGVVVWVQAGDHFVDVRSSEPAAPLSGPGAFAGTTTHAGHTLTWHHTIDFPAHESDIEIDDVGLIEWADDGSITETGSFPDGDRTVHYTEHWISLTRSEDGGAEYGGTEPAPMQVLRPHRGIGLAVRHGDHLAALHRPDAETEPWAATHLVCRSGAWSEQLAVGDPSVGTRLSHDLVDAMTSSNQTEWMTNDITTALSP